ncbi:hypothetical protein EO93_02195 [Methanosarcina sp. 1.H.A.2.2]|nr:hypothetical protein EO93_02195 [Methanosarcina sp. 1.H.A.2.2]
MSGQNVKLPCFETVINQMVENIYRSERCRYSALETKLIEDFEIKSDFRQEDSDETLEFKEEIYWVFKYLKMIRFIQNGPVGLISISSKGMEFLNRQSLEGNKLENIKQLVEIKDYLNSFELEIDPIVVPYNKFTQFSDEVKLKNTLNSFYCSKDSDIQDFIRNNIERFEDKSICRSYLILDRKNNDNENFYILGFFALSLKILYVDQNKLTRKQKKDMNLLKDQDGIPSYFIAQLGKNDMFKYNFKGEYLLNEALNIVYRCIEMLGGTIVWLEANKGADYVMNFYKDYGFMELQSELQEDQLERTQLVKYLNTE